MLCSTIYTPKTRVDTSRKEPCYIQNQESVCDMLANSTQPIHEWDFTVKLEHTISLSQKNELNMSHEALVTVYPDIGHEHDHHVESVHEKSCGTDSASEITLVIIALLCEHSKLKLCWVSANFRLLRGTVISNLAQVPHDSTNFL